MSNKNKIVYDRCGADDLCLETCKFLQTYQKPPFDNDIPDIAVCFLFNKIICKDRTLYLRCKKCLETYGS